MAAQVSATNTVNVKLKNNGVGDTIVHGTATLTLRSLTVASFVSEGTYA